METFEVAEAMWRGKISAFSMAPLNELVQVSENMWFYNGVSNMCLAKTAEGLVIIDPGAATATVDRNEKRESDCVHKYKAVRKLTQSRVNAFIYTHGHQDHIYGGDQYVQEDQAKDWPYPRVIAHENIIMRIDRYRQMKRQIEFVNKRQFAGSKVPPITSDMECLPPNLLYRDTLQLQIGGTDIVIRHGRGETDDPSWVYFPNAGVVCTGDFFIWAMPNVGNPQKVQRYAREWANELRAMLSLKPKILLPGHGLFILGEERVAKALDDTAAFLESIHAQTIDAMNKGLSLEEVINLVAMPMELSRMPYLQAVYDEPEFIIRNIWRFYGGWYDGVPSHLKPAGEKVQAEEIANLAGGALNLSKRAEHLLKEGDLRMATHLAEWACLASPEEPIVRKIAQQVYAKRAEAEKSVMAKGIFMTASQEIVTDDQAKYW